MYNRNMKNILFISDSFLHGGLESHIAEQIREYKKNGINTFIACDNFEMGYNENFFQKVFSDIGFISKDYVLSARTILDASEKIINICKKNNIDFIECQPFWNIIPAVIAAEECKIPVSYTLHGTASGDFVDHVAFREASIIVYLCLRFGFDRMFAVSERLANIYAYLSKDILVTRNNITEVSDKRRKFEKKGNFVIASRMDVPKSDVVMKFLPYLYKNKNVKRIDIYGDGDCFELLSEYIKEHGYENKVFLKGWVNNLPVILAQERYDCAFGVGRIVMDAISAHTPVGILGYGGFTEIIDKNNIESYAKTNFISWDAQKEGAVERAIRELYANPTRFIFSKKDLAMFNAEKNWKKHIDQLSECKYREKSIIEEMRKLLKANMDENILGEENMMDSLYSLLLNSGDSCVHINSLKVFCEYFSERNKKMLAELEVKNEVLGQKNQELEKKKKNDALLIKAITNDNEILKRQVRDFENSTSWKITKPIRKIKDCFK